MRDETGRREAGKRLCESEERYRALFDSIDEDFCVIEVCCSTYTTGRWITASWRPTRRSRNRRAWWRRKASASACLAPPHEEHWFDIYGKVALTGEPIRFESPAQVLNRWYDVYAFRVGRPEGRRVAVLFNDTTARKRAEESLRDAVAESERARTQIEAMFQAVADGIMVCDMSGNFLFANAAEARINGRHGRTPPSRISPTVLFQSPESSNLF